MVKWSGEPAYKQVAAAIRKKIKDEKMQPGDQLPSLDGLMTEHGVSVTVARFALRELKAEGLVNIAPGKGNFVADPEAVDKTEQFERAMRQIGTLAERVDDLTARLTAVEERVARPGPSAVQGPRSSGQGQR